MSDTPDKIESEIESLEKELKKVEAAMKTSQACKSIGEFVGGGEGSDPLLNHTNENPYLSAPNSGGGCCTVS